MFFKETVGNNAGKVYRILKEQNGLSKASIVKSLKIKDDDFNIACGWLLREDKIMAIGEKNKRKFYIK